MKYKAHLVFLLTLLVIGGCKSVEKATAYLDKKGALPKICADRYPPKESVIERTTLRIDTLVRDVADSVECPPTVAGKPPIKVPCPPAKDIIKIQTVERTVTVENTARIDHLTRSLDAISRGFAKVQAENAILASKAKKRGWLLAAIATTFVVFFLLKIRGKFPI